MQAKLVYRYEPALKGIALVIAIVIWVAFLIGTLGGALVYLVVFFLFYLFAQSALIANLKGTAVRLTAQQMPDLHERIERCCRTLGIETVPEAYLLHGNGVFNAFATRFLGRNFIVLFSDVVDALEESPGAVDFYIGHELGHIARNHLGWGPVLAPALFLPLLGAAYSRAREYTCDLHGVACCGNPGDALRGLSALAAGHRRWRSIDLPRYQDQAGQTGGFWMSFHELVADYPWLTKRMVRIAAYAENTPAELPTRNVFAWVLAAFVPRIPGAGGAGFLIVVAVIGILAAIAIPAYQDYVARAVTAEALGAAAPYKVAVEEYSRTHDGELPASNNQAGIPAQPRRSVRGVSAIDIGEGGQISIEFSNAPLAGKSVILSPEAGDDGLSWSCLSLTVPPKYLPPDCR